MFCIAYVVLSSYVRRSPGGHPSLMGAKTAISLIPPMVLEAAQFSSMRGAFALSLSIMENLKSMTYRKCLSRAKSDTDCIPAPEPGLSDLARKSSVALIGRCHRKD